MATWAQVIEEAPDLAAAAERTLDAGKHKTLATLRRDGSPRISGTEAWFWDGQLWFGSMWRAVKALDLKRDPRFALHSASIDPEAGWSGDAKVAGTVEVIEDGGRIAQVLQGNGRHAPKGRMHLFRAELREVVHVHLNEDHTKLVIDSWHEGQGMRTRSR